MIWENLNTILIFLFCIYTVTIFAFVASKQLKEDESLECLRIKRDTNSEIQVLKERVTTLIGKNEELEREKERYLSIIEAKKCD